MPRPLRSRPTPAMSSRSFARGPSAAECPHTHGLAVPCHRWAQSSGLSLELTLLERVPGPRSLSSPVCLRNVWAPLNPALLLLGEDARTVRGLSWEQDGRSMVLGPLRLLPRGVASGTSANLSETHLLYLQKNEREGLPASSREESALSMPRAGQGRAGRSDLSLPAPI